MSLKLRILFNYEGGWLWCYLTLKNVLERIKNGNFENLYR